MAYTAPEIKDRVAVGDDLYVMAEVDGKIKLTPSPTEVSEPGTEINKAFLQALCDGLEDAWEILLSLADIATSGSYNDLKDVPHYDVQTINITSASWSGSTYTKTMPSRYLLWSPAYYLSNASANAGLFILVNDGKAYGIYCKYMGSSYNPAIRGACGDTSLTLGQSSYNVCDLSFTSTHMTVTKQSVSSLNFAYLQL